MCPHISSGQYYRSYYMGTLSVLERSCNSLNFEAIQSNYVVVSSSISASFIENITQIRVRATCTERLFLLSILINICSQRHLSSEQGTMGFIRSNMRRSLTKPSKSLRVMSRIFEVSVVVEVCLDSSLFTAFCIFINYIFLLLLREHQFSYN